MLLTVELSPHDGVSSIVSRLEALTGQASGQDLGPDSAAGGPVDAVHAEGRPVAPDRVLFAAPRGFALSLVELLALRHEAATHGITIAFVTGNAHLRSLAARAGISTFRYRAWAAWAPWRKPRTLAPISRRRRLPRPPMAEAEAFPPPGPGLFAKRSPSGFRPVRVVSGFVRRPNPWWIEFGLALALVATMSGLLYSLAIIVPAAEITVVPVSERANVTVPLRAMQDTVADAEAGTLPARALSVQTSGEATGPSSGRRREPSAKAQGNVLLVNRTARGIQVPAGTVVATATGDTQRFVTRAQVEVPPNGRVSAGIEALLPGLAGNVRAGTITRIEGSLAGSLAVANEGATGGGGTAEVGMVTEDDQKRLQAQLHEELKHKALEMLREKLTAGEFLPPDSVTYLAMGPAFTPFVGDVSPDLSLTMSMQAVGLAVKTSEGNDLALKRLQSAMSPGTRLITGSIRYIPGSIVMEDDKTVSFSITAEGVVLNAVDARVVRTTVLGMRPDEAAFALTQRFALAQPPAITLGPDWLPLIVPTQLPALPWRIRVNVDWDAAVKLAVVQTPGG